MNYDPHFEENVLLKEYCTYHIGGPARFLKEIRTIEEMQNTLIFCNRQKIPFLILGKGSNCLFDDRGFNGAVLVNKIDFCEQPTPGVFHVGAGYSFPLLGVQTAREGFGGLEFASGIPASVGGAVFMNAGANGNETCRHLDSVDYIHEDGTLKNYKKMELAFAYRSSPFQKMRGSIVGATFKLFSNPEARKTQVEIVNRRKATQPLSAKSAGCVFLNPPSGYAGELIEKSKLKGTSVGGAQVSEIHGNFLINANNATAKDILGLMEHVKEKVKETTGFELKSEIWLIPYEPDNT